ncbi:MAG: YceI family protein [Gammaproteobacteria bacterium]|nr:YceI family protein [Gammaproteobacteria bacterium]
MRKFIVPAMLAGLLSLALPVQATERYVIDTDKHHAFITFKIKHLGYSWLLGRFDDFSGSFEYDEANPSANKVDISIAMNSIDTNHAERDKHLRSDDFFDVEKYPKATFTTTSYSDKGNGKAILKGALTLHGVKKEVTIDVDQVGTGPDPWGGYRRGFEGTTTLHLSDYDLKKAKILGPAGENVELYLSIEGIRQ